MPEHKSMTEELCRPLRSRLRPLIGNVNDGLNGIHARLLFVVSNSRLPSVIRIGTLFPHWLRVGFVLVLSRLHACLSSLS
jgi:hypothetical protein